MRTKERVGRISYLSREFTLLFACLSCLQFAFGNDDKPVKETQPITFHTVLIIKRVTDIEQSPFLRVQARLSDEDIQAVKTAFEEHTAYWVNRITNGRVRWSGRAVVSDSPLLSVNGDRMTAACGAANYPEDIRQFVKQGEVDGVFVYFKHIDDQTGYTLPRPFGLSIGPNAAANWAGQSCIHWCSTEKWSRDSETTEIILHEWLHQLESFYAAKGVVLPRGRLHGGEDHGYRDEGLGKAWKRWYTDFLNGAIQENQKLVGLGENAWVLGTIRADAQTKAPAKLQQLELSAPKSGIREQALAPTFINSQQRARNLLSNACFEEGMVSWSANSWKRKENALRVDDSAFRRGRSSLRLRCDEDVVHASQKVKVKPFTNYLLSGWVKTKGVRITEAGGKIGANLWVVSTGEVSQKLLVEDNDWTYLVLMFYSQDRTEVEVAVRLGGYGSALVGRAWFDDLNLIELCR